MTPLPPKTNALRLRIHERFVGFDREFSEIIDNSRLDQDRAGRKTSSKEPKLAYPGMGRTASNGLDEHLMGLNAKTAHELLAGLNALHEREGFWPKHPDLKAKMLIVHGNLLRSMNTHILIDRIHEITAMPEGTPPAQLREAFLKIYFDVNPHAKEDPDSDASKEEYPAQARLPGSEKGGKYKIREEDF